MGKPVIKSNTHDVLKVVGQSKPKLRKAILEHCDNDLIQIICDCVYNVVKGNIPGINKKVVKKLVPHKKTLIKLTKRIPLKEKRKTLVQNGGLLPLLFPLVAPLVAPLIAKGAKELSKALN